MKVKLTLTNGEVLEIAGKVVYSDHEVYNNFLLIERNISEDTVAVNRANILIIEEEYA